MAPFAVLWQEVGLLFCDFVIFLWSDFFLGSIAMVWQQIPVIAILWQRYLEKILVYHWYRHLLQFSFFVWIIRFFWVVLCHKTAKR